MQLIGWNGLLGNAEFTKFVFFLSKERENAQNEQKTEKATEREQKNIGYPEGFPWDGLCIFCSLSVAFSVFLFVLCFSLSLKLFLKIFKNLENLIIYHSQVV